MQVADVPCLGDIFPPVFVSLRIQPQVQPWDLCQFSLELCQKEGAEWGFYSSLSCRSSALCSLFNV